ncbi:MAG TPA: hypothetical protein VNS09_01430 [Solirubrobacter sp.]|nr:hypothetical protein [Solirubrobacter sp.]
MALVAGAAIYAPAVAHAGTYEVVSCGAAGGINRAWTPFIGDAASLRAEDSCSSIVGGAEDGLLAVDRIPGPPNTPAGGEAGWRLAAPPGTRITRLTAHYYLGQRSAGEWLPFIRTAEGAVLQSCVPTGGQTTCERGSTPYSPIGPADTFTIDTAGIDIGVRCAIPSGQCGTGASLHHVWAALYGARVQVSDQAVPSAPTASGTLWRDGYHRGIETVAITASDTTGIRATRLLVDDQVRVSELRACDYTLLIPCSNGSGGALTLDTRTLADGVHNLDAVAEDPAGNMTKVSRSITVDNEAPAAPVGLVLDGRPRRSVNGFAVRWQLPPGQVAPITGARWSLCPASGTTGCVTGAAAAAGADRLDGLAMPSAGDWDLRVWLEDAAGNSSAERAAGPVRMTLLSARDPKVRIRSVRRKGRLVRVSGVAAAQSGRVAVSVERRVGNRVLHVRGVVRIRAGRWSRQVRLTSRMARLKKLTAVARFAEQSGFKATTARRAVPR